jgi:hypothetical protein
MKSLTPNEMDLITGGNPVLWGLLFGVVTGLTVITVGNIENNWPDFKAGFVQGFNNALK